MQDLTVKESDWRKFKKKIVGWQQGYMDRLNHEYIDLLNGPESPGDKFWMLYDRMRQDMRKIGVEADMRRSKVIGDIIELLHEEAITMEDLEDFSQNLQDTVKELYEKGWREPFLE